VEAAVQTEVPADEIGVLQRERYDGGSFGSLEDLTEDVDGVIEHLLLDSSEAGGGS
jgi:hypothetical protein